MAQVHRLTGELRENYKGDYVKESLKQKYISITRLSAYSNFDEYRKNLLLSKNAYIPLSILEIALRNALNDHFSTVISPNWHQNPFLTPGARTKITDAITLLKNRKEAITKEKIIAELNFGFWVNLFQKPYQNHLRTKDLQHIFPNMPSKEIMILTREIIYKKLDHIRGFRNRIFHYEKVINKDHYNAIDEEIYFILGMFDRELSAFARLTNEMNDKDTHPKCVKKTLQKKQHRYYDRIEKKYKICNP